MTAKISPINILGETCQRQKVTPANYTEISGSRGSDFHSTKDPSGIFDIVESDTQSVFYVGILAVTLLEPPGPIDHLGLLIPHSRIVNQMLP
jgi:hypothetical protein